jgi:hypothetical protein
MQFINSHPSETEFAACINRRNKWTCKYGFNNVQTADEYIKTERKIDKIFNSTTLIPIPHLMPSFLKKYYVSYKLLPNFKHIE